jgi:NitT/TauT family transport system substrate-binding protein
MQPTFRSRSGGGRGRRNRRAPGAAAALLAALASPAAALETVNMAIPTKSFQQVIYPLAQERGYMREEGIDLKIVFIEPTPSIQAALAGSVQLTAAGTSALVAVTKAGAPLKVVLAVNDRVHQWLLSRPEHTTLKSLRGKKIATTGVASVATFMLKQIVAKHGLDPHRDLVYLDPGSGNQLPALLAGAVDAAVLSVEQRYVGLDNGMRELVYFGNEVKNSWGTLASTERFIREQPKRLAGFLRATLKALRLIRQDRESTVAAVMKFSGIERPLAARIYDDLIGTFTRGGVVDEETQRNDLEIIRQVVGAKEAVAPARAYDFSFALAADRELARTGWRP